MQKASQLSRPLDHDDPSPAVGLLSRNSLSSSNVPVRSAVALLTSLQHSTLAPDYSLARPAKWIDGSRPSFTIPMPAYLGMRRAAAVCGRIVTSLGDREPTQRRAKASQASSKAKWCCHSQTPLSSPK